MAQPLTLEMARAHIGSMILKRFATGAGRPWLPVRLVEVVNDETVRIRPPGHKRDELEKLSNLKLSGKQSQFAAKASENHSALNEITARRLLDETGEMWVRPLKSGIDGPRMQVLKVEGSYAVLETSDGERMRISLSKLAAAPTPIEEPEPEYLKQPPKFNGKPKEPKPVIALTPEDLADIDREELARTEVAAPESTPEPIPEPAAQPEPMNPREIHRQKQIKAAAERFVMVDRLSGRFFTQNKKWVPELGLARRYTSKGCLTARGLLLGSRGRAQARDIEVMTVSQATELVSRRMGVDLAPTPVPAAQPTPAPAAPVINTAPSNMREQFDAWAKHRRDAGLAERMRLEALAAAAEGDAELDIAVRKRALGL